MFSFPRTDWSSEAIRILKTDLNLSSSLLEIDYPRFLIFWFYVLQKFKYFISYFSTNFLEFRGIKSKKGGKSISSRHNDKFKSVFEFVSFH